MEFAEFVILLNQSCLGFGFGWEFAFGEVGVFGHVVPARFLANTHGGFMDETIIILE